MNSVCRRDPPLTIYCLSVTPPTPRSHRIASQHQLAAQRALACGWPCNRLRGMASCPTCRGGKTLELSGYFGLLLLLFFLSIKTQLPTTYLSRCKRERTSWKIWYMQRLKYQYFIPYSAYCFCLDEKYPLALYMWWKCHIHILFLSPFSLFLY
jgi:hypothetical protein